MDNELSNPLVSLDSFMPTKLFLSIVFLFSTVYCSAALWGDDGLGENNSLENATDEKGLLPWNAPLFDGDPKQILAAVAAIPDTGEEGLDLLLQDERFEIDAEHRVKKWFRQAYRIRNQSDVENYGHVQSNWNPWLESKPTIRARVISPDGSAHELDPKTIAESSANNSDGIEFLDKRILSAPLPAIAVGSIVEFETSIEQHRPFCPVGITGRVIIQSFSRIRRHRIEIACDSQLPLTLRSVGADVATDIKQENGKKVWRYRADRTENISVLWSNLPDDQVNIPFVAYSTGESWDKIGEHFRSLIKEDPEDESMLEAMMAGMSLEGKSHEAILETIVGRLNKVVRYTGVQFGSGAIVPRTITETLTRRYGDCKDQSILLVRLLQEAGIQAHIALINASSSMDILRDLPGLNAFDHVIVWVPPQKGNESMWIDPTEPANVPGMLSISCQGRTALVLSDQGPQLRQTDLSTANQHQNLTYREVHLLPNSSRVQTRSVRKGAFASLLRDTIARVGKSSLQENWEQNKKSAEFWTKTERFEIQDVWTVADDSLTLSAEYTTENSIATEQGDLSVTIYPGAVLGYLPESLTTPADTLSFEDEAERPAPYKISFPHVSSRRHRIIPPPGFTFDELPPEETIKEGNLSLTIESQLADDGAAEITIRMVAEAGILTIEEHDRFRDQILELAALSGDTGWALNVVGRFDPLTQFEEDNQISAIKRTIELADQQSDVFYQRMLVDLLLVVGLGEEAREVARRAISSHPESPDAHLALGQALLHDRLGNELKNFDRAESIQTLDKSVQLARSSGGDHAMAEYTLALVLERGATGLRPSDHPDRARDLNERLVRDYQYDSALSNLCLQVAHANDLRAAQRLFTQFPDRVATIGTQAALTMVAKGVPAGTKFIQRAVSTDDDRTRIANYTIISLRSIRRYDLIREYLETFPQGTVTPTASHSIERVESDSIDLSEPTGLVKQLYAGFLSSGLQLSQIGDLYANLDTGDEKQLEQVLQRIPSFFAASREQIWNTYGCTDGAHDLLSLFSFRAEAVDSIGHRVTIEPRAGLPMALQRSYFVVQVGQEYRIFDEGIAGKRLGLQAERALENGDTAAAKSWLELVNANESKEVSVFNPFAGTPFARCFYMLDDSDAKDLKLLASLLASRYAEDDRHLNLIADASANANSTMQLQLDRARCHILAQLKRHEELLELASKLSEQYSAATEPARYQVDALVGLGRIAEARQVMKPFASRSDNHVSTSIWKILDAEGGHQKVYDSVLDRLERATPSSTDASTIAWRSLFIGKAAEAKQHALDAAVEAQRLDRFVPQHLHTLACVQAELGDLSLAARTLRETIVSRRYLRRSIDDWVLGRISEHLGLTESAKKYYQRVAKTDRRASTYELAQLRLKDL